MSILKMNQRFDTSIVKTFKSLQNSGAFKSSIDAEKQFAYGKTFASSVSISKDYGVWFLPHTDWDEDKWFDAWKYEIIENKGEYKEVIETFDANKKKSDSELERAIKENETYPTRLVFAKDKESGVYIFLGVFTVEKPTRNFSYTRWSWKKTFSSYSY